MLDQVDGFTTKLQKGGRIQVPAIIKWKNRLGTGQMLTVTVYIVEDGKEEEFYAKLNKGGRFVVPKIIIEKLELKPREMLEVKIQFKASKNSAR